MTNDRYSPDYPAHQAHVRRITRMNELEREIGLKLYELPPWRSGLDGEPEEGEAQIIVKARALRAQMQRSKRGREILEEGDRLDAEHHAE